MKQKLLVSAMVIFAIIGFGTGLSAQEQTVTVKPATHYDVSKPLTEMSPLRSNDYKAWKSNIVKNHFRTITSSAFGASEKDGAVQSRVKSRATIAVTDFEGVGSISGVAPPDTDGDVGPNHYVQVVNSYAQIFDKSGNSLWGPSQTSTFWDGFTGSWTGTNDGDAVILYDETVDRWVVTQFAVNSGDGTQWELLAVSATSDPTGAYYRYAFEFTDMPDYPKLGVWHDGYYMAANRFTTDTQQYNGTYAVCFERDEMLLGNPADMILIENASSAVTYSMLPSDCDGTMPAGTTPNYFCFDTDDNGFGSADRVKVWAFTADWDTPANSTFAEVNSLVPSSFNTSFSSDAPIIQPNGAGLMALNDRMMFRNQYRNFGTHETMVLSRVVNMGSDQAAMRWYELRNTGSGWDIYQEGTFSPDNSASRWMGSIAMNGSGDIALGYSITSNSMVPSIAVTGRLAGDPLGQMTFTEAIVAGTASQSGVTRWGDYSRMSVDPSNDATFWYTQEYSGGGWDWKTKVLNFNLVDLGDPGIVATAMSASQIDVEYTQHTSGDPVLLAWSPTGNYGAPTDGTAYMPGQTIPGGDAIVLAYGSSNTYNHTSLTSSTTYYYKAWTNEGSAYSPGRTASATTFCENITTFPFSEGFEGGQLPVCWTYEGNSWSYQDGGVQGNPASAHTGNFNAIFSNASTDAEVSKLITPSLNFTGYSDATFSFWHTQADWSGDQDELRVYYKTSVTGQWVLLETYTSNIASWTQETVTLPNLSADCYIAFEGTAQYGFGVTIDDFNISGSIGATAPTANFTASNTSPAVAENVLFTDISGNFPTTWTWSFSPNDVTFVGGTDANSQNPQVEFGTVTNYTVTLVAENAGGTDTETKVSYISICTGTSMNSGGTWTEQVTAFPTASRGIQYISIVDENTVWATAYDGSGGDATIQEFTRTTDGGTNWTAGSMGGYANYGVSMIYAIDANKAFVPLFKSANPNQGGEIAVTTDGGETWNTSLDFGTSSFCNVVHFFDANNGVSQGDPVSGEFEIFRTTDGGANWTQVAGANIPDPIAGDEYGTTGLYDAIGNTIWFTTNKGRVYKSTDKGANWTVSQTPETDEQLSISFSSLTSGIVKSGTANVAYSTSDGGQTWSTVNTTSGTFYNSDYTYVPGTCNSYVSTGAGTPNGVSFSDNGGTDWTDLNSPQVTGVNVQLTEVRFFDENTGWAGQFNVDASTGGIYKYEASCASPVITSEPEATASGCEGNSVTISVTATGTSPDYQWQKGGIDINLATSASYTIASLVSGDAGNYSCIVSNACGTVTSTTSVLTVSGGGTPVVITDEPESVIVCNGDPATFEVTATGSNLTYQWQFNGSDIDGEDNSTLVISNSAAVNVGNYTCIVTGDCETASSAQASLTVNNIAQIISHPQDVNAVVNDDVSFTVTTAGVTDYQWQFNGSDIVDGGDISGANTSTLSISSVTALDDGAYTCNVSGPCGIASSNAGNLMVSTSVNELVGLGIQIFPNPSDGIFTISSQKNSTMFVVVTDITGKVIFTDKFTGKVNRIDLSGQAKGMYFVQITIEGRPTSAKLIIE